MKEIERKFLVRDKSIIKNCPSDNIVQGYIATSESGNTVRVRIINNSLGLLTIKGPSTGIARVEIEVPIPCVEALELIKLCSEQIYKLRYEIKEGGHTWYVDKYKDVNEGLMVAEIEFKDMNTEVHVPDWIGTEITHLPHYYNSNISITPFCKWSVSVLETHHQGEQ